MSFSFPKLSVVVFCVLVARLLDVPRFNLDASGTSYVTMHQLMSFFEDKEGDLPDYLLTLAGERMFTSFCWVLFNNIKNMSLVLSHGSIGDLNVDISWLFIEQIY